MKLSVCTDAVFYGQETTQALSQLSEIGWRAFEFWSWWDKDVEVILQAKERLGLTAVSHCTHFISLVDEAQRDAYIEGLQATIETAKRLGVKTIISQVGDDLGISRAVQKQCLVAGLKTAVSYLQNANMQLVIEPLNILVDHPGYFLIASDEGFEIIEEVNSPHVKLLFDIYHQQISEGHLIRRIVDNIDKIGHFHAAGNPGRHELDFGELNYSEIFKAIRATDYDGYVGLEYFPQNDPISGLMPLIEH
ncbi:MAG: TIM barrel protein [Chloroflexota bacterium]